MPAVPVPGTLCLHTLRVAGDYRILVPLGAWLVPQGALAALHTLVLDVTYLTDDYDAPDARPALVLATALSLRELTLQLDPPMPLDPVEAGSGPLCLASFPRLRTLNLRGGYDATIEESLAWLAVFLLPSAPSSSCYPRDTYSAFEELSFDHSMRRGDLLARAGCSASAPMAWRETCSLTTTRTRTRISAPARKWSVAACRIPGRMSRLRTFRGRCGRGCRG
ncbi:hypothetical protein B0H14DRAFT_2991342 [Mycena olivaceomarginata]|nr:hypothetical protein B0H14DRAFT_2991342 [Mycena olivaceomarginata]